MRRPSTKTWWVGAAAIVLLAVSAGFSVVFEIPFLTVLKPFTALVLIGVVLGWGAYNVVEFNPYEY